MVVVYSIFYKIFFTKSSFYDKIEYQKALYKG